MGDIEINEPQGSGGSVLAYVDEAGTYDHVLRTARTLAKEHAARLILYRSTAAPGDPIRVPDAANGGSAAGVTDPLSAQDLRRVARPVLASAVEEARAEGIDAWGWVTREPGVGALMRFAEVVDAEVVVLPAELGDPAVFERLRGEQLQVALERGTVNVVVVDREGRLVGPA
jgi:nucleotide-binding universal stress UspA family protein